MAQKEFNPNDEHTWKFNDLASGEFTPYMTLFHLLKRCQFTVSGRRDANFYYELNANLQCYSSEKIVLKRLYQCHSAKKLVQCLNQFEKEIVQAIELNESSIVFTP